jgi:Tfp pilus assembly protein PilN
MLVKINLLPERSNRDYKGFFAFFIPLLIGAMLIVWSTTAYWHARQALSAAEHKLDALNKVVAAAGNGGQSAANGARLAVQRAAIEQYVQRLPRSAHFLFDRFVALLPDKKALLTFDYNRGSGVELTVQLSALQQVSDYYRKIKSLGFVKTVRLIDITSSQETDGKKAAGAARVARFHIEIDVSALNAAAKEEGGS